MSFRHSLGAAVAILIVVVPLLGQNKPLTRPTNTYSISGSVRDDASNHEMENIPIELKNTEGALVNSTFTRGNGEFEFDNLSGGEYFVEIDLKDYEVFREKVELIGSSQHGISISLTRPIGVVNKNSGASISVHQLGAPRKAHDEFDKALSLLYVKSDYRGAIAEFQRAIKDYPTYYEAYAQMGGAYSSLGEMVPAEQAMRKSIELSTGQYPDAIFMLAGLLNNIKRYSEAETFARQGIALDAVSWHGPFELARALTGLKQLEAAERSANQARDSKPDNPPVYLMLANIHIERRDYAALLKDLDAYLKLVPTGQNADNARKTRDKLQAAMENEDAEPRANATLQSQPDEKNNAQDQSPLAAGSRSSENNQAHANEQERPVSQPEFGEPDDYLLPSLPPPSPKND